MSLSQSEGDEETVPLNDDGSQIVSNTPSSSFRFLRRVVAIIFVLAIIGLAFVLKEKNEEDASISEDLEGETREKVPEEQCSSFCKAYLAERVKHHGGNLLHPRDLLEIVTKAREDMINTLKEEYGDAVFKAIFTEPDGTSRGDTLIWGASDSGENGKNQGPSKARFRRKLKIKLLEAQHEIRKRESNVLGCDCTQISNGRSLNNEQDENSNVFVLPELPLSYSEFVWVTGGHSAAAAHGNLYNESYTAYMEKAVKTVFGAVGLDFIARNYAMGAMSSATEIALCQESLFGVDADLISWDYGMTDGSNPFKKFLFDSRIGMHRNRPAAMDLRVWADDNPLVDVLKLVEEYGLSMMYLNFKKLEELYKDIPDMFGMSDKDMTKVGPFARDIKCNGALESDSEENTTCYSQKYSDLICPDREGQAGWHPGWRVHAVHGNILGLFLADMLLDAIKELGTEPYDSSEKLATLQEEDAMDYIDFSMSTPDFTKIEDIHESLDLDDRPLMDIVEKMFRKPKMICHTGLLPAEIRFLGILTETDQVGPFDFDKGISLQEAQEENGNTQMRLVYEPPVVECPVEVSRRDRMDFFYTSQNDGWTSLTLPNKAETDYYLDDNPDVLDGIVILCFIQCFWGECQDGEMHYAHLAKGKVKLEVNGVGVSNFTFIHGCGLLRHGDGEYNFKANKNGQYEIRAFVEKAAKGDVAAYARVRSIIIM